MFVILVYRDTDMQICLSFYSKQHINFNLSNS